MTDPLYYEVTGNAPLAFCRDWRTRTKAIEAIYSDYAKAKGGIGFTRYFTSQFGGVIFEGAAPLGWKEHRKPCSDGAYFSKPVKRGVGAVEGKAFQAEVDALPAMPSEDEFCQTFGFPTRIEYTTPSGNGFARIGYSWKTAQIAWNDDGDSFWIVLPDFRATVAYHEGQGHVVTPNSWEIPGGMKLSSRARYELAEAQVKVAREDAA